MAVENVTVRYDRVDPYRESHYDKEAHQWTTKLFPWRLLYLFEQSLVERHFATFDALVAAIRRINGRRVPPHVFIDGAGWRQQECAAACHERHLKTTFKSE